MYKLIKHTFPSGNFTIDITPHLLSFLGRVTGDIERVILIQDDLRVGNIVISVGGAVLPQGSDNRLDLGVHQVSYMLFNHGCHFNQKLFLRDSGFRWRDVLSYESRV